MTVYWIGFRIKHRLRQKMQQCIAMVMIVAFTLSADITMTAALAAVTHNSDLDWYSLESEHFIMHYHTGEQDLVKPILAIAERVHRTLSPWMQWQPLEKTELLLTDEFDIANGAATVFPNNRSYLFVSAPDAITSLEDHSSWMETLITHEYMHILHLDKAINSGAIWRTLFGRIPIFLFNTFPAASLPNWSIEGLATYKETDLARGIGRGQSSYYDMLMRLEVVNGVKPVHQVNQAISSWPMGTTNYLYGVNYYQFIEHRYETKTIHNLINDQASALFPFRVNNNTENVLDKNLVLLWDEFEEYLNTKHQSKIESITQQGITAGTQLTHNGYFDQSLTSSADGTLYYVSYDALKYTRLMKIEGRAISELRLVERGTRLDYSEQSGLLLTQPSLCNNSSYYYDLFRIASNSGVMTRLTECARYRYARWSPDGESIIVFKNGLGKNEIVLLDANGNKIKTLWQGPQDLVLSNFDWSPDGQYLIAAIFRDPTGWNIERFDILNPSWEFITKNSIIENYPIYSADGKSIYYSAEHDGVYNIFKQTLATNQLSQLSNVLGAAFYPTEINAQGDLYYMGFHSNGMDIYHLKQTEQIDSHTINQISERAVSTGIALTPAPEVETTEVRDYSPWSSLQPRWWFPIVALDSESSIYGFATSSSDILNRHNFFTTISYDSKNKVMLGNFDYIYDRYWPILKLHYDRQLNLLYDTSDNFARARINDTTQLEAVLPFLSLKQRFSLHFAIGEESSRDARTASAVLPSATFKDQYYGVAFVYNNASKHARSISRSEGREITLSIEDSSHFKDSFYQGTVKLLDWREFIPLGGKQVLAFRVVSGRSDSGSRRFRLGGTSNTNFAPQVLDETLLNTVFNRRDFALRGYQTGLTALTGSNINLISAEYRFPLFKLERGFMTPPIGLHEVYAGVFYDSGASWNNDSNLPEKYYSGIGIEFTAVTNFFFKYPLKIVLGRAKGLDKDLGEKQTYLRLGAAF